MRASPQSWSPSPDLSSPDRVPVCPYVAAYVKRHHDWDDLLDRVDRQALDALRQVDS